MTFELRTYTPHPGKLDAMLARFRDHTVGIFETHGMHSVGYWVSEEDDPKLSYILRHDGDAEQNWEAFRNDAAWINAKAASEVDGELTASITTVYMRSTDFSAIK